MLTLVPLFKVKVSTSAWPLIVTEPLFTSKESVVNAPLVLMIKVPLLELITPTLIFEAFKTAFDEVAVVVSEPMVVEPLLMLALLPTLS